MPIRTYNVFNVCKSIQQYKLIYSTDNNTSCVYSNFMLAVAIILPDL